MKRALLFIFLFFTLFFEVKAQDDLKSLRVISYNIWNGFDWGKDADRHQKFLDWATFQKADIMALQELCAYTPAKLKEDAKAWGHEYSVLLKEEGYSVGLTSKWPIQLIGKYMEGMWHGMLHVKTAGIDIFVVHLSPADWKIRTQEANIITQLMETLTTDKYIVLGDFNAHSPTDADLDKERLSLLARTKRGDVNNAKHDNLRHDYWDYTAMSIFLAHGLLDVTMPFIEPSERFSFPTPILANIWQTESEIKRHQHRIDYILCSPALFKQCVYSRILNGPETAHLSDHYPVIADFIFDK